MLKLSDTTLLCIDTENHVLAQTALLQCATACAFDRVVYLSDVDWNIPGADFVGIAAIHSLRDYNHLILKEIAGTVDTGRVLIVQYDGFILHPERWDEAFAAFDYIGAPWPMHPDQPVGNGGFSLRSRRLLEALGDPAYPSSLPEGEDELICRRFRDDLERRHGIRFAPPDLALRFSHEVDPPPPGGSFGFHGLVNAAAFYQRIDPAFFIDHLGRSTLAGPRVFILLGWYAGCGLTAQAERLLARIAVGEGGEAPALRHRLATAGLPERIRRDVTPLIDRL